MELTIPVGRAVTMGKPEAIPLGIDEAAALMSESREFTTPEGSAVTGRLTPPGRPDDTTPGIAEPALISESKELIRPDGSAVTGKLTPPGRGDWTTPGIELTPALIWESKELTIPVGSTVTGKLTPDGRPEGKTPGIAEPALMSDSSELMIPVGIAVTAGKPEARPDGKRPAADEIMALASLRMLLTTSDGSTVTGKLTPPGSGDWMTPGMDVAPALIAESRELTIPVGRAVTMGKLEARPEGTTP
jgi:hypothetical protein